MSYNRVTVTAQGNLLCPHCEGEFLHHDRIKVYGRVTEDDEDLVKVTVETTRRDGPVSQRELGNPSARRDGVAISFWCELCEAVSELTIAQHKGMTEIGWRKVDVWDRDAVMRAVHEKV